MIVKNEKLEGIHLLFTLLIILYFGLTKNSYLGYFFYVSVYVLAFSFLVSIFYVIYKFFNKKYLNKNQQEILLDLIPNSIINHLILSYIAGTILLSTRFFLENI